MLSKDAAVSRSKVQYPWITNFFMYITVTVRVLEVAFTICRCHKALTLRSCITILFAVYIINTRDVHNMHIIQMQTVEIRQLDVGATLWNKKKNRHIQHRLKWNCCCCCHCHCVCHYQQFKPVQEKNRWDFSVSMLKSAFALELSWWRLSGHISKTATCLGGTTKAAQEAKLWEWSLQSTNSFRPLVGIKSSCQAGLLHELEMCSSFCKPTLTTAVRLWLILRPRAGKQIGQWSHCCHCRCVTLRTLRFTRSKPTTIVYPHPKGIPQKSFPSSLQSPGTPNLQNTLYNETARLQPW